MNNKDIQIFNWIVSIIDTCYLQFHFEAIDNLIALYYERQKDDYRRDELEAIKLKKWNEIHNVII